MPLLNNDSPPDRVVILLENLRSVGNGIEISSVRRARMFHDVMGVTPWIVTSNFNPALQDHVVELKRKGNMPSGVLVRNVYEWLAEMGRAGVVIPLSNAQSAQESPGVRLVQLKRGRAAGLAKSVYVDAADKGQIWREDFALDGCDPLLQKDYVPQHPKQKLQRIFMRYANGVVQEFKSESEWVCHIVGMNMAADLTWHFQIDKNKMFRWLTRTPAIQRLRKTMTAVIHSAHLLPNGEYKSSYKHLVQDAGSADRLITLTQEQRADLISLGVSADRLSVIPNVFSALPAQPSDVQRVLKRAIFLARYAPEKQHELLIRVFQQVLARVPDAELCTYGAGPMKESLERQVRSLGLERSIKINGYVEDIASVYRAAGIGVIPSREEGFSNFGLECLSYGCPLVSFSAKYGPRDLLEHQHAGLLIAPDDEAAMALALIDLFEHPKKIESMRPGALRSASRYTPEVVTGLWREWLADMRALALHQARDSSTAVNCVQL